MAVVDLELLLRPAVLAPTVALVGLLIYQLFFTGTKLPNIPIVGAKDTDWFPAFQAKWRNTLDFKHAVRTVDARYYDTPVRLPILGVPSLIIVPRSDISWVNEQPDTVISMHAMAIENLQTEYTSPDPYLVENPVHHHLITTTLTNQIGNLIPDVVDEISWGFEQQWGTDQEWSDVCVYETLIKIVSAVTNRVFVGKPLCRNPEYLKLGVAYAQSMPVTANVLRAIWLPIRPLAALLLTLPIRRTTLAWNKLIFPEIKQRLAEWDSNQRDPEKKKGVSAEKNDFLQWSIAQAKESGDPYMWKPATLAGRILLINFAAIHTSSFSITSAILDLAYGKKEYIDELREEISTVLAEFGGEWNKRALVKMIKLDSTMRESQRLNSFVTVGLMRVVVAKDGVTTRSGLKLPNGVFIAVPAYVVLNDEKVYSDAAEFKPFRFADERKDESVDYIKRAGKAWATTSNDYLAFGHGRNACPGRFFAANEIKLMLAHILMNYDIEPTEEVKPASSWYSISRVPPMKAKIRIRRRQDI
ncbi:cytochrome P450 [Cladorrhinum sp. PSN259]|nr:cytochrome P450 [Cladorrhinum sp. PSN259]